ncbi:hypothetical protein GCM10023085_27290 [Actinomadura viridis]|uniref:DUF397 domain-containing protein n=1 Tax=Actinomadura viridis TaxID=58110 RepID=A0A931DHZ6_9ACTN|nr:DUF397 domain-containing protein [Actinomadura viridis]MBG6087285.1 hypothetical protein [Actinomadura viridis]
MDTQSSSTLVWRKSGRSGTQGSACVEIAAFGPAIAARDSKDLDGPFLYLTVPAWKVLLADVKSGRLDL